MPAFKKGERVNYKPVGGPASNTSASVGVVRAVATQPGASMTGRNVEASEDEPRYEIENEKTHKSSAVKEANIIGPAE
ncbi:hypothetical protein N7492_008588 [Penicillium capsulatum]|uniref:Hypervirulence associated protein TUDOR domain-containing protein n=1 Tax=Penicillium capsulatum TaxID=69766 RepID=A0A9W9LHF0_9EURO|nr:hypothetical protein N7492_008588 [Penicillium capsulatum]KAJ6105993.1 hypothetical protein N7512_009510 [Penicillium capsulatum]